MRYFNEVLGKIYDTDDYMSPFKTREEMDQHWQRFVESRQPVKQVETEAKLP